MAIMINWDKIITLKIMCNKNNFVDISNCWRREATASICELYYINYKNKRKDDIVILSSGHAGLALGFHWPPSHKSQCAAVKLGCAQAIRGVQVRKYLCKSQARRGEIRMRSSKENLWCGCDKAREDLAGDDREVLTMNPSP